MPCTQTSFSRPLLQPSSSLVEGCRPLLSWQWGVEVLRAPPTPPPGIRHWCLSGNHCVCLLCPLLPLPVPTSPYPWLLLRLSLEVMTILCRCENIETSEGVPLFVTGVAQVITHLLPPLFLTFSLPALWGPEGRSRMDLLPESAPPSPLFSSLLLWVPRCIPVQIQVSCCCPLRLQVGKEQGTLEALPKSARGRLWIAMQLPVANRL